MSRELATRLREGVVRNRIAHGYALLDDGRVQSEALIGLPALRSCLTVVGQAAGL